jgi:hypothetical protein
LCEFKTAFHGVWRAAFSKVGGQAGYTTTFMQVWHFSYNVQ